MAFAGVSTIVSITPIPPLASTSLGGIPYYENGENIDFNVKFNESVNISGTPELQFELRGLLEEAVYNSGTGTDTIRFRYIIPNHNNIADWNGITAKKFKLNVLDAIKSLSTAEETLTDFPDISIPSILVDTNLPNFNSLTQTSSGGVSSGGSVYLNAGDTITSTIELVFKDTRASASIDFDIGGTTKTLNFTGTSSTGESKTSQKTTPGNFLNGENGIIKITNIFWEDQAEKAMVGPLPTPAVPILTNFIVDTTLPIVSEVTTVTPAFTTDNTPDYTFTTDEAGSITYGGGCSSPTVNAVSGNNTVTFNTLPDGTYNCTITVTDIAGNNSLVLNMTPFTVDTTAPVFSNIGVISDNIFDPNSGVGSTRWAGMKRDEFVGKGKFWTEEASKDFTKRYNAGKEGYVKGYVNRNGYTVFGGYVPGKIAVDRYPHRFQNQIVYRDKKVKKYRNRHSIAKKQKAMKKAFQHPEKVKLKSTFHAGIGRGNMNIDASKTAISGKIYRKHYVNKFTKTENRTLTHSRIRKNSLDNIYMRVGGKSITMSELQRGTRIRRGD